MSSGPNAYSELFAFDSRSSTATGKWEQIAKYPGSNGIYSATINYIDQTSSFYVTGGYDGNTIAAEINAYDTVESKWKGAGKLYRERHGHGSIWTGDALIIAGGGFIVYTEICELYGISLTCRYIAAGSQNVRDQSYPELFLFTTDYCQ